MDNLPKVKGLSTEQQTRLDAELSARKLTTLKSMRSRPSEVVAALQAALEIDVQSVLIAYGDLEARQKQVALDRVSIEAVNVSESTLPETKQRVTRRGVRPSPED